MSLSKQDSEYTFGLKYPKLLSGYGKVLNMAGFSICDRCTVF